MPSTVRKPERRLRSDCFTIRTVLGPGEAATRVQAPRKAGREEVGMALMVAQRGRRAPLVRRTVPARGASTARGP
ncbi:hypothetical protein ASE41_13095 [Streptomyces sp. Root264]|nr:hypothetical protein ASE41_13095 [Streptomyces sp. Root264]